MEIIYPLIFAAVPLFALSFLLVFWAIKHEYISIEGKETDLKQFKKTIKQNQEQPKVNLIHKKWLFFGGGFYGLMAFITYIHVEVLEVADFIASYTTFAHFIEQITLGALIELIIQSFLNLIPAFTWFLYWPKQIDMLNGFYWLIAAYVGYQVGTKFAHWWVRRNGLNFVWRAENNQ
jgi:uncharacterized membrane protein